MKSKPNFSVREGKGGKYDRFYVWNAEEQRVQRGKISKSDAIELEHKLNRRKFRPDKKQGKRIPWYESLWRKIKK